MKVMQINSYPNGSTGAIAKSIHNALQNNGDECVFAYGIGSSAETDYKIGTERDFKLHTYGTLLTGLHGYFSYGNTKKLIEFIKAEKPNIVHLHNLHGGYLNIKILLNYLKESGIPVVITLHDCWLFTGKCYHFYEAGCEKWKTDCGKCPQKNMYPKSLFFDFTAKMHKDKKLLFKDFNKLHLVAVSDWLCNEAKQSFLGKYPLSVIHNGIDTAVFKPTAYDDINEKYGLENKFVILGVASSWNNNKGFNEFLELSKKLQKNEVIVLVGVTESEIASLPSNCIGITRTENKNELAKLYSRADVFMNFSVQETFGLVTAEAMACGTPTITSNTTACGDVIADGTGYSIPPRDVDTAYKHIKEIQKNGSVSYRDKCVSNIKENYTIEKMTEAYIELYQNLIK